MTTLRATILFTALVLTCNGAPLVASQTNKSQTQAKPTSLFYERQTTVTTLGGQPSTSSAATLSATAQNTQAESSQYTSTSSSSANASIIGATTTRAAMADEEHKKIIAWREQKEQAEHKQDAAQLSQQAYAKIWLQAALGPKQKALTEQLANITILPKDLAKLIAQYEYEFRGNHECTLEETRSELRNTISSFLGNTVHCVTALTDNRLASTSNDDYSIKIWNTSTGKCELILQRYMGLIDHLTVLQDGRLAATHGGIVEIWNTSTEICELFCEDRVYWVTCLTCLRDGRLAVGYSDGSIKIWNTTSGQYERPLSHSKYPSRITCLTVLPDDRLASGGDDGSIKIWNTTSGQCELNWTETGSSIRSLIALPDGRLLSLEELNSGSCTNTIRIWNTSTKKCEFFLKDIRIRCLTLLPDGQIAEVSEPDTIKIWSPSTNSKNQSLWTTVCSYFTKPKNQPANTHKLALYPQRINRLTVLPDSRLAVDYSDGTIKIWS